MNWLTTLTFSSGNLRKTSWINCPENEKPLAYLNNPLFVLPLGSNIFSLFLFTHSLRTLILCLCHSFSLSLCIFPLFLLSLPSFSFCFCLCLILDSVAYLQAASRGKQPAYSKGSALTEMQRGRRRMEWGKQKETEIKFPWWFTDISARSPHFRENTTCVNSCNGYNCILLRLSYNSHVAKCGSRIRKDHTNTYCQSQSLSSSH